MYMGKHIKPASSLVGWLRRPSVAQGSTTVAAIGFFLWAQLWPTIAGAKELVQKTQQEGPAAALNRDALTDALSSVKATLTSLDKTLSGKAKSKNSKALEDGKARLKALRKQLIDADRQVLAGFDRDLEHIKSHNLSDVIKQRQADALAKYRAGQAEMLSHLDAIDAAKDGVTLRAKVKDTKDWLDKQQIERKHQPFDPKNLPFRVGDDKVRAPKRSARELNALFRNGKSKGLDEPLPTNDRKRQVTRKELASLDEETTLARYKTLPTESAEIELAVAGSTAGLMAAKDLRECMGALFPGQGYCDETEDVQITADIQAKADELGGNPVAIYNWVHDNVDFVPSYGSVQGSEMTYQTKRGNAFDTSSLLIAMLRASGIPARFAYGTVQIPTDKLMNWIGGFTDPDAAQNILGQGGIPNIGLVAGGRTVGVQIEHIWVEAFVDFYPSRGAKNRAPDTWVPLDASFKRYTSVAGSSLESAVPFDAQGLATAVQQGATISAEGWVLNANQSAMQAGLDSYAQQLTDSVSQTGSSETVDTVLGSRTILSTAQAVLAARLPYAIQATAAPTATLPPSFHHKFRYSLYADDYARANESDLFTYEQDTAKLAGKEVTLIFAPATDDDRQTIASYMPQPHADGSPIRPEEFPSSVSAYQIRVNAELRVAGEVVASAGSFTLGEVLIGEGGFTRMNVDGWDLSEDLVITGGQLPLVCPWVALLLPMSPTLMGGCEQPKQYFNRMTSQICPGMR